MPAKSIKQQGLFGIALSVKKGDKNLSDIEPEYKEKIKSIVDRMTKKSIKDFASTKHKKLPMEVKEENEYFNTPEEVEKYEDAVRDILLRDYDEESAVNDFIENSSWVEMGLTYKWTPEETAEKFILDDWEGIQEGYVTKIQKTIPTIITQLKPESNKASTKNKMAKMQNLVDYRDFITKKKNKK